MRKVFIEDLPKKHGIGGNKSKSTIDWRNCIKQIVKFTYDNISGELEISDYDGRNIYIKYLNNKPYKIKTTDFVNCRIGGIIGVNTKSYKYNIDNIINDKIILKQIRMSNGSNKSCKGYLVKCIYDGYEWEVTEYNLIKRGCPVCSNKIVMIGVNDIATTHPELIKYFQYIADAKNNTHSCTNKVAMVCPNCGFEKTRKIDGLAREGFVCPKCGDGTSIPEKFMLCVLEQLIGDAFSCQKCFQWSNNKRYDFCFNYNNKNYIIETHGAQHYEESRNRGGRSLQEEQLNDKLKYALALNNGIDKENYIVIDCRRTEFKYMKNNILNSQLNKIFDFNKVDWIKCKEFSLSSRVKEACDYWNNGIHRTKIIGEIMKLSSNTICTYLKLGKELSWTNYSVNANIGSMKKVLFIEEQSIFENATILANYLSLKYNEDFHDYMIRYVCRGKQNNYKGFHFEYI